MGNNEGMKAIKWAYVYGQLDVEIFDTLDEAADMAEGASEYGSESLRYIEHDGNLYDIRWVDKRAAAKRAAQPPAPPVAPVVCYVEVRSPDGKWAMYEAARSMDAARRAADECMEVVGDDRVRLVPAG